MYPSAKLLVWVSLALPLSAAECVHASGEYEGYRVLRVGVQTPLEFPAVHVIERALLGPVMDSMLSVESTLPIKEGAAFSFSDHVSTMGAIRDRYGLMRPGERLKLVAVFPRFSHCDDVAKTLEVDYRVYTTDAAYFASRLLESSDNRPDRKMTIGTAAETTGRMINSPFVTYNRSRQLFGGIRSSWTGRNGFVNQVSVEAAGSSSSHDVGFDLGGFRDPAQGIFSHLEWKAAFRNSSEPAGRLELQRSTGSGQFLAATRAHGPLGMIGRFGVSVEGGYRHTANAPAGELSNAPHRALKTFGGATWSHGRQIWNASYAFQVGKGTDTVPVDYTKQIVDVVHQIRFLPSEHWPIRVDTRWNGGWIKGSENLIPVAERFFGGNALHNFVDSPLWWIQSTPLLRSIPENRLNLLGGGLGIGGKTFTALNVTIAPTVWRIPAMPPEIRGAKEVGDGILLGMEEAEDASLQDYRAQAAPFHAVMEEATAILPHLNALHDLLAALAKQGLSQDVTDQVTGLSTALVDPAIDSIHQAQARSTNGLAWSNCRTLAQDPENSKLGQMRDMIHDLAPLLDAPDAAKAQALRQAGEQLEADRLEIVKRLAPLELLVGVEQQRLDKLNPDLDKLSADARILKARADPLVGEAAPIGPLANAVSQRALQVISTADDRDPDPFRTLYKMNRLAVGVGKLVSPQVESTADLADQLAAALTGAGRQSESAELSQEGEAIRRDLAQLRTVVLNLPVPPGERWARQQNAYFTRALDVAFREMNLAAISPVVMLDAARIGPVQPGFPGYRYGVGGGVRFSLVTFDVTLGYSVNPNPRPWEPRGALFFSMAVADLFR